MSKAPLRLLVLAAICGHGLAISCYSRSSSSSTSTNGTAISCSGSQTSCYSYIVISGNSKNYHSGCGTCDAGTYASCVTCSTDYCNSLTPSSISCYSRNAFTSGNGIVTTCPTGVTTCYNYTYTSVDYAGCGNCTPSASCSSNSMCSTSYCNRGSTPLSCYSSFGDYLYTQRRQITCSSSDNSCYEYSYGYGYTNFFFAGCGTCSEFGIYSNCRTCSTDYCNSALTAGISLKTAAAAAALMLAVMKLF